MGVMACSRRECENIMCTEYVYDVGYVCHECKEEFCRDMKGQRESREDMKNLLIEFMMSPKHWKSDVGYGITAEDLFNNEI